MTLDPSGSTRLVVVGCSWGGLDATAHLLQALPEDADCALAVAQHRGPAPSDLAELWSRYTTWPVIEPEDKEAVASRHVYVAPPAYHLMVEGSHLALSTDAPHNFSRPSIDVLFESAARAWGHRTVAVVLTGANADGAAGARAVAARGGLVLAQDPEEAVQPVMPRATIEAVPGAVVLPVEAIAAHLARLCPPVRPGARSTR